METIHERPEWISNYKKPIGTEIKYINGHWYLYERKSVWDAEKGKPRKKSGKLIGTITESGLILKQEKSKHEELVCYEFGASFFMYKITEELKTKLESHYDKNGILLYSISFLMLKESIKILNVSDYYKESYLKILEGRLSMTPQSICEALQEVSGDEYFKNELSDLSYDVFKYDFNQNEDFESNKNFLEVDDEMILPLYYLMDIMEKMISSFLRGKQIDRTPSEAINLLKTFHVIRDNRKYIKAKPLKSVDKLIEKLDMEFTI